MQITWFGPSCFRFEPGSSVRLIDPVRNGSPTIRTSGAGFDAANEGEFARKTGEMVAA